MKLLPTVAQTDISYALCGDLEVFQGAEEVKL